MTTVAEIYDFLDGIAPFNTKAEFDNVGLLAGFSTDKVTKIMTALDITEEVIQEAKEFGAQLIVSHHPLFFSLKAVSDKDMYGKKAATILRNGMSAICMHTNLDAATAGVNDKLAKKAGLKNIELLCVEGKYDSGEEYGIGRVGELEKETPMSEYLVFLKDALKTGGIRYYDSGKPVKKVAVVGGSAISYLKYVLEKGCDTFITADIKYDNFLDAKAGGYNLIDADHFCTENVVIPYITEKLREKFPDIQVEISKRHGQTIKFI